MSLYVNRVTLEFNGASFSDFDSFTDTSVIKAKQVNLMNKTGHALMTPRYGFTVSVNIPGAGLPIDLDNVQNGTCTVEWLTEVGGGGKRVTYSGVYTLETGDGSTDGETELTREITFGAENRVEE